MRSGKAKTSAGASLRYFPESRPGSLAAWVEVRRRKALFTCSLDVSRFLERPQQYLTRNRAGPLQLFECTCNDALEPLFSGIWPRRRSRWFGFGRVAALGRLAPFAKLCVCAHDEPLVLCLCTSCEWQAPLVLRAPDFVDPGIAAASGPVELIAQRVLLVVVLVVVLGHIEGTRRDDLGVDVGEVAAAL